MSQFDVAEKLGVTQGYISRLEAGSMSSGFLTSALENDILIPLFAFKVPFMYLCGMDKLKNIKRMPNADIVLALSKRFRKYRKASHMTQAEVSEKSGVSLPTVKRFELGLTLNIKMGHFIALLKAIDFTDGIAEILPEISDSPYALAKLKKKKAKQVRLEK